MKPLFGVYARPHLVGIGGVGMEALARLLKALGCRVSGTDLQASAALAVLSHDGFAVRVGHAAEALADADLVVYSAAVSRDNPELRQARRTGIPVVSRAQLLGLVAQRFLTVAVAGSHGKTTTASMLAGILIHAGWNPSVVIGGRRGNRAQARLGEGRHLVVEADEFRRAFLELLPGWALVTNVEAEHLDCYADLAEVEAAFAVFLRRMPFYGHAILAGDGQVGQAVLEAAGEACATYGLGPENAWRAVDLEPHVWGSRFQLVHCGQPVIAIELQVPGTHNLLDALGAAAMALHLGVRCDEVRTALRAYTGVSRRFELRGEMDSVTVVDDYAHHPSEVAAVLRTAHRDSGRVLAVFQPHLYSRTQALYREFGEALLTADEVFLLPIYGAREDPVPGVDSSLIAGVLRQLGHPAVHLLPAELSPVQVVLARCRAGDTILTLGAGDVTDVAGNLVDALRQRTNHI